jgi:hypothetical protein
VTIWESELVRTHAPVVATTIEVREARHGSEMGERGMLLHSQGILAHLEPRRVEGGVGELFEPTLAPCELLKYSTPTLNLEGKGVSWSPLERFSLFGCYQGLN